MRLNIGANDRRVEGFLSVDICPPADIIADLSKPWPWDDSTVDEILAYDVIEHLPNRVHTFNEMHRVLKAGAQAVIEVPNAARGAGYFQDPTHVAPFCLNSFQYIRADSFAHRRLAKSYGITAAFRVVTLNETMYQDEYEQVWKIHAVLECIK